MNFGLLGRRAGKKEGESGPTDTSDEATAGEEEAVKEERYLASILEVTRRMYFERGLVGSIYVSRSLAFYVTSLNCDVDGTSVAGLSEETQKLADEAEEGLTRFERKVVTAVRGAMHTLQKRALAYRNKGYRKDLTLSCGISVSDPFLGMISTSISCSATVASLLGEERLKSEDGAVAAAVEV